MVLVKHSIDDIDTLIKRHELQFIHQVPVPYSDVKNEARTKVGRYVAAMYLEEMEDHQPERWYSILLAIKDFLKMIETSFFKKGEFRTPKVFGWWSVVQGVIKFIKIVLRK